MKNSFAKIISIIGLSILFSLSLQLTLWAKPVKKTDVKQVVKGWLTTQPYFIKNSKIYKIKKVRSYKNTSGKIIFYVASLSPYGYVVVAPDDILEPIIACSAHGKFLPDKHNFLWLLVNRDMKSRIKYAAAIEKKLKAKQITIPANLRKHIAKWNSLKKYVNSNNVIYRGTGSVDDPRVDPIIQSQWSQEDVNGEACYNYYTPTGSGNWEEGNANNYPCGCIATAMGQLMRYHQYPTDGVGTASFTVTVDGNSETKSLRGGDGSGGAYDWSSMTLVPSGGITETGRKAIGALLYDCGVSVHMQYTSEDSGAYMSDAATALVNTFKYSNAINGESWPTELTGNGFTNMANPNLDAGLPVLLGISGSAGGHAIVCDGYGYNSGTIYHHLNMGWAGSDDAWYNLPTVDTTGYSFDTVDSCIYNIYKSGTGEIISGRVTDSDGTPQSGLTVTASDGSNQYTATTNSRGIWAITNLPSGTTYTVSCESASSSQSVSVGTSITNSLTVGNVWQVDFTVADRPTIAVDTTEFNVASVTGKNASSESFQVWNSGKATLNYTISDDADWLECTPTSGDSTGTDDKDTITVNFSTTDLPAGSYTATITITDSNASNSPQTISVSLTVEDKPYINVSITSITASCNYGENPASQTVDVWNSVSGTNLNFQAAPSASWLSVSPNSGISTGESDKVTLTVSFNASKLGIGEYNASITVSAPDSFNKNQIISVTLTVGPANIIPTTNLINLLSASGNAVGIDDRHRVYFFGDESGNKCGASQSKENLCPILTETITGKSSIYFNGKQYLYTGSKQNINLGGPFSEKTVAIAFRTGSDVLARQVLFAQGTSKRGFNAYIYQNNLFFAIWNKHDDAGTNTAWGPVYISTEVLPSTLYTMAFVFDQPNDEFKGYKNGSLFNSTTGVGKLYDSKYGLSIGKAYKSTLFHDGKKSAKGFKGYVCDIFYYNDALTSSDINKINDYISDKYKDSFSDVDSFVLLLTSSVGVDITCSNYVKSWKNATASFSCRSAGKCRPLYEYDILNSLQGITFDGVDDIMKAKSSCTINNLKQGISERTIFVVFKTGRDISSRQVIWAEGNKRRGLNIYIYNGNIYIGGWNDVSGRTTSNSWGPAFIHSTLSMQTAYYAELVIDSNEAKIKGFLRELSSSASLIDMGAASAGKLLKHPAASIGAAKTKLQYADGTQASGNHFNGTLFELIVYNKVLSSGDENDVINYLINKYIP